MKKERYLLGLAFVAALGLLVAVAAYAHDKECGDKGAKNHRMMMKYDPKTVATITGEVVKVKEWPSRRGTDTGIGLLLKTDKGEVPVHIGPASFLEKQGFKIGEKDKLEITGSKVTGKRGKTFLLAAQVKKGDAVLKLRDESGKPLFAPMKDLKMKEEAPATEPKPETTK